MSVGPLCDTWQAQVLGVRPKCAIGLGSISRFYRYCDIKWDNLWDCGYFNIVMRYEYCLMALKVSVQYG